MLRDRYSADVRHVHRPHESTRDRYDRYLAEARHVCAALTRESTRDCYSARRRAMCAGLTRALGGTTWAIRRIRRLASVPERRRTL